MNRALSYLPKYVRTLKEIILFHIQSYGTIEQKYGVVKRTLAHLRGQFNQLFLLNELEGAVETCSSAELQKKSVLPLISPL